MDVDGPSTAQSSNALFRPMSILTVKTKLNSFIAKAMLAVIISIKPEAGKAAIPVGRLIFNAPEENRYQHRNTYLGINIIAENQGKGYGGEAIRWAVNWAFQNSGMHRVALTCFGFNLGAAKLYERVGFKLEGKDRDATWFDGRFWDILRYSILEDEWRAMGQLVKLIE